jgi:hypothetical protein
MYGALTNHVYELSIPFLHKLLSLSNLSLSPSFIPIPVAFVCRPEDSFDGDKEYCNPVQ